MWKAFRLTWFFCSLCLSLYYLTALPRHTHRQRVKFLAMDDQLSTGFAIEEATIEDIHREFSEEKLSARNLVDFYLNRIETLNPKLRAVIEVNPDAGELADRADLERKLNGGSIDSLGDLHGIPVLLKDTIGTKDKMNTTAGSYALLGSEVPRDAGVVEKLRKAGAIILGKASLSEWYKFRSISGVPNGWCARSGQGINPYVESRTPCGSSSGSAIAVAANLATVSLGTETHSSIICPADHNSVVGFKPTVGLTSRAGVIPMAPRWDSIGPICRTVSDAVRLLNVIAGFDPRDAETSEASKFIPQGGYVQFLSKDGLVGKRLGVVKHPFLDKLTDSVKREAFEDYIKTFRRKGAIIIDDLQIEDIETILEPHHSGEMAIMMTDFKVSIDAYLKELITSPVRSLADIIAFNKNNSELEKLNEYDQRTFIQAEETDEFKEHESNIEEKVEKLSQNGFEKVMSEHNLDAMVTPGALACGVAAIGGFPAITVPAGYGIEGMPFGISFSGLKGTEPTLIEIAYAYEQETRVRKPPSFH